MLKGRVARRFYSVSPRTSESMQWTDVGILGGGIVGSALACALASHTSTAHLSVSLLDGSDLSLEGHSLPDQTFSNRVVSLTPSSQAFLKSVGIWEHLDAGRVFPYAQMTVWDGASGSGSLTFNASTLEGVPGSNESMGCIVENVNLHLACLKRLKELGSVQVRDKVVVDEIARDPESSWPIVSLQTFDKPFGTSLLVGADGGMSKVRDFAKIASLGWDYQQKGLVATLKIPEEVENRTAYQRFLPTGPIAFLPMGPGYTSLVWTLPNAVIPKVLKLEPKAFATLVNTAFRNPLTDVEFLLSQISDETGQPLVDFEAESSWGRSSSSNTSSSFPCPPEILQVQEGSRAAFPLRLRNAEYYAAQRVALVGDAAHSIHPLAGQGLNLGLADAQALCSVLAKASENGSDLGHDHVLEMYSRQRYIPSLGMLLSCDGLSNLFGTEHSLVSQVRSWGLDTLDGLPIIKRELMKWAS